MKDFLRQSQVLTTFGPGAMVDLPDRAVLIEGLQSWHFGARKEEIHEPRLQAKLKQVLQLPNARLVKPPAFDERLDAKRASIGARIFPEWFLVQEATPTGPGGQWRRRRLVRFNDLHKGGFRVDDGTRRKRTLKVVPVRFVCGCPRGHLDELDWRLFAHRTTGPSCGRAMWLEERGTSGDIADTVVGCDCGIAPRPLYEALALDTRALGTCKGRRPWLGPHTEEACAHPNRLLVRSASNAYFPQLLSVISLPDSFASGAERLDPVWNILQAVDDVTKVALFRTIPDVARALEGLSDTEALEMIERRKQRGASGLDMPVKVAEFEVLDVPAGTRGVDCAGSSFYAETLARNTWDTGDPALQRIERVVLVHRLREVVTQVGFTRFDAAGPDATGELDLGVESAALDVNREWFPAIENRGEGVFLVFGADKIQAWLARDEVKQRAVALRRGCEHWSDERPGSKRVWPGVAYVMLHSVAHLLLTQIALDCGYPAASLRERVYALADRGMYGILIHTGTSDAEGTLGGLVEAGSRIGAHLSGALEAARLCSNDPVCAEHDPTAAHDPLRLHGAACHGCLLVAETSCEQRNDWLDRALVVPTVATPDAAFFA